jgi:hypothetical protein
MAKGKRRTMVFIGTTVIEVLVAMAFGIDFKQGLPIMLLANALATIYVDYIYKRK